MKRRTYVMTARAAAAEETATAIVTAFTELFLERGLAHVSLREVADRAGVSVQTVIRRFGDKDGLTAAAASAGTAAVDAHRRTAVPGDLDDIVDNLLDHYDDHARVALRLLAEEDSAPAIAPVTATGRRLHREWCERVFAPWLGDLQGADHDRRLAQLVAVCDVYTWKLLHVDAGLGRRQLRVALLEMLAPLTTQNPTPATSPDLRSR
jgi:AcrR family transcriptional regulator